MYDKKYQHHLLSEDLGLTGLRIAKVHGLIQQLVNDHEVITDTLLLQLTKVVFEYLHDIVNQNSRDL